MEAIKLHIENELKDFRSALSLSKVEPRQYNKQSSNVYKPEHARFKLVVWFKDGNRRYFYSMDNVHLKNSVHIDEFEGFKKLLRLLNNYEGKYTNAIIYATTEDQKSTKSSNYCFEILKRDRFNNQKENKIANFNTFEKNVVLDIKKLETYSKEKI